MSCYQPFPVLERPLVVFDLETTGLDLQNDRIVELAAMKIGLPTGSCDYDAMGYRFNPGIPISAGASAVHHITDADVADRPPFAEHAEAVLEFFRGCDLAGFNIRRFDVQLLMTELRRCGLDLPLAGVRIIDCCDIFHKREPRTLEAAMRFYCGREHERSHVAMGDVLATLDVLAAQLDRYPDLPRDVGQLSRVFFSRDWVDFGGKLRWVDDRVCINFGKNRGVALADVGRNYLLWMRDAGVIGPDATHIITEAIEGRFPEREKGEA